MFVHRSYYTLEEIAKRWNCEVSTLLLLAHDGELAISLPPEINSKFRYILNPLDFLRVKFEEKVEVVLVSTTLEGARGIIKDKNGNILSDADLESMPYEARKEILRKMRRSNKLRLGDNQFAVKELVITHEEIERFKRENPDRLGVDTEPSQGTIWKPKRTTDLGLFLYHFAKYLEKDTKDIPLWQDIWRKILDWVEISEVYKTSQNGNKTVILGEYFVDITKDGKTVTIQGSKGPIKITSETVRNWHRHTYIPRKR